MSTVALVLAAGASRRMGRPKALLPIDGETFLARIVRVLAEGGADTMAVVVGGRHREEIERAARELPVAVSILPNQDPGEGPITSVRVGVSSFEGAGGFLIHPVDIPGVESGDVSALLAAARARPECEAVVPSVDRRAGHPVWVRGSTASQVLEPGGVNTLRELLWERETRIHFVDRSNRGLLRDIDRPEDLDALDSR